MEVKIDYIINCIVPVKLSIINKGSPKRFAIICLATTADINSEPVEPTKEDQNQMMRKQIRADHKCLLKRLKKKRKSAKQIGKVCY